MNMEAVSLSGEGVFTLKRVFLNVLSGRPEFLRLNREHLSAKHIPERFLVERKWSKRGDVLEWTGSEEEARQYLEELIEGSEIGRRPTDENSAKPTTDDRELLERIEAVLRKEEQPKGLWCFNCVFRFSAAQFCSMFHFDDWPVEQVERALRHVIHEAKVPLLGTLGMEKDKKTFIYIREDA